MTLFLAAQAATIAAPSPMSLDAIGQQKMPAKGCAAFVWSMADRKLVAMATAEPAQIRLSIDGRTVDLARVAEQGEGGLGFGGSIDYAGGDVTVNFEMKIVARRDLTKGAQVTDAVLRVERRGGDALVVPVAGLIGCA
ncbi:hypothetical protein ACT009_05255 [Sphingomonas sp. Tas61C01]|uniref:hypothetical protein n=1 Tax=Sphingomonas sp. Tas61C01 TaxID=3458297 RepID=UPI00403E45EE